MVHAVQSVLRDARIFMAFLCFLFATSASSQGESFERKKAERLADIDERLKKLQEHRACVSTATTYDALSQCRDAMRDWRREKNNDGLGKRQGIKSPGLK